MDILRNLPVQQPAALRELISIQPGRVVSMALSRSEHCQMTLLAFGDGESISEERYFGDTVYYVLEGDMPLRLEGHEVRLGAGDCLAVPAQTTHAIGGRPLQTAANYHPIKLRRICMEPLIKNLPHARPFPLKDQVGYEPGKVVSLTLAQRPGVGMTLFAFDAGEAISTHAAPGDAMATILEGTAQITIDGVPHTLNAGEAVIMPAGIPHAVQAVTPFKMYLVVAKQ